MSRLAPNQLTVRQVDALKNGLHCDGGNLWISVDGKSRAWSFRYKSPATGRRREMGLGSAREIGLAAARKAAAEARELLRRGLDPIDARDREAAERQTQSSRTFQAAAEAYADERRAEWARDRRGESIWRSSMARLAFPHIGEKPVSSVETADILAVLRPIWTTRTETADRLRGRIERVLDYARTHGWRDGPNPAIWKGHLSTILPKPSAVATVKHHAAIPYAKVAPVMAALSQSSGAGAAAVRFACLTAARSGEVRGATWGEIDLAAAIWTIPAERMKGKKEHRVPLSAAAIEVLRLLGWPRGRADLVFQGARPGKPLSDVALSKALHSAAGTKAVTVHGLRSTFRDWVAEAADYPRDVAEMALAHAIGDRVEAAYRRGDLFEKRRAMMEEWGSFAAG